MNPSLNIEKRSDARIHRLRSIRDGKEKNFIFCEGDKIIAELLSSDLRIDSIYIAKSILNKSKNILTKIKKQHITPYLLADMVMAFVSDLGSPPGIIAIAARPQNKELNSIQSKALVPILHGLQLPQNIGAILRTGEAAGVSEVFISGSSADPFGPKVLRASSGSAFRLKIYSSSNLQTAIIQLRDQNLSVYGITQNGNVPYNEVDWTGGTALVLGPEGKGFSKSDLDLINTSITIPMQAPVESLNVGVAAGICLFEASRQRREKHKTTQKK